MCNFLYLEWMNLEHLLNQSFDMCGRTGFTILFKGVLYPQRLAYFVRFLQIIYAFLKNNICIL